MQKKTKVMTTASASCGITIDSQTVEVVDTALYLG